MAIGDPIADMLTRITNAAKIRHKTVNCLNSKVCRGIADVLKSEGYIDGFDVVEDGRQGLIRIKLRYSQSGDSVISSVLRESKPGRRVYRGFDELPKPMQGLGIAIVSTSRGVMSDRKAREAKVGGELLCTIN
jgi:small subunit ribosomal protein S8